jgi:hypothetical protein
METKKRISVDEEVYIQILQFLCSRGYVFAVKKAWNAVDSKIMQDAFVRNGFPGFRAAVVEDNDEILSFLWNMCPEKNRQEMIQHMDFECFKAACRYDSGVCAQFLFEHCSAECRYHMLGAVFAEEIVSEFTPRIQKWLKNIYYQ